jgi:hypothetical protein
MLPPPRRQGQASACPCATGIRRAGTGSGFSLSLRWCDC